MQYVDPLFNGTEDNLDFWNSFRVINESDLDKTINQPIPEEDQWFWQQWANTTAEGSIEKRAPYKPVSERTELELALKNVGWRITTAKKKGDINKLRLLLIDRRELHQKRLAEMIALKLPAYSIASVRNQLEVPIFIQLQQIREQIEKAQL